MGIWGISVEIEGTKTHILKSGGENVESGRERERESRGWVGDGVLFVLWVNKFLNQITHAILNYIVYFEDFHY